VAEISDYASLSRDAYRSVDHDALRRVVTLRGIKAAGPLSCTDPMITMTEWRHAQGFPRRRSRPEVMRARFLDRFIKKRLTFVSYA
jgi:hypothetical protein